MEYTLRPSSISRYCRKALCLGAALLLCANCSPHIRQFYPDTYYTQDNTYENKTIGFLVTFRGAWNIITDPALMNRHYRLFAKTMQNAGGELLFMGSTVEELYGVKAVAINLNESPGDYAAYIRSLNKKEVQDDSVPVPFLTASLPMVKWEFTKSGYRFVEFFFVVDTYNVRISFWTKPALYENFLPVFEDIISSVSYSRSF